MSEEIGDFDTENVIANFKFRLTNWTLDQYASVSEVLSSQKNCLQMRCLREFKDGQGDFAEFSKCVKNCETGIDEVIKMH